MKKKSSGMGSFILVAIFSIFIMMYFAYHWANLLFLGDNSVQFYISLKNKKEYLESEIKRLQRDNAYLQKEYLELKNLEPEE